MDILIINMFSKHAYDIHMRDILVKRYVKPSHMQFERFDIKFQQKLPDGCFTNVLLINNSIIPNAHLFVYLCVCLLLGLFVYDQTSPRPLDGFGSYMGDDRYDPGGWRYRYGQNLGQIPNFQKWRKFDETHREMNIMKPKQN